MARVVAPIVVTEETRSLACKITMAQDPLRAQYRQLHAGGSQAPETVGCFLVQDPDHGAWPLTAQQRGVLNEVTRCIDSDWIRNVLLPFTDTTESRHEPSLRLLDWFVTNYSKSKGTTLGGVLVHSEYVNVRRAYQCRHFDPFRRNLKVTFVVDGQPHYSTVGQINFLLWADHAGVLAYVRTNRVAIDKDMCETCRETRLLRKNSSGQRKRTALSQGKNKKCRLMRCDTTVDYTGVVVRG